MHSILVIALIILPVQLLCVDSAIIRGQSISRQKSKNNQETLDTTLKEIDCKLANIPNTLRLLYKIFFLS